MGQMSRHCVKFMYAFIAAVVLCAAPSVQAAERSKVRAFLQVTGFDVALESIRLSADSAPLMLGVDANAFGSEWQRLVREIFDTGVMHDMATDFLVKGLGDAALNHAAAFYASDLGARLVAVENKSHMDDSDAKQQTGDRIIAALSASDDPRLAVLERLNTASGGADQSVRAIHEIQVRFLLAAAGAGVVDLTMDENDLRAFLATQEDEVRADIEASSLRTAAFTYAGFSNAELTEYAAALEHPTMQEVYALMNAVQFEIMANRFEAVADRLSGMQPSQDL